MWAWHMQTYSGLPPASFRLKNIGKTAKKAPPNKGDECAMCRLITVDSGFWTSLGLVSGLAKCARKEPKRHRKPLHFPVSKLAPKMLGLGSRIHSLLKTEKPSTGYNMPLPRSTGTCAWEQKLHGDTQGRLHTSMLRSAKSSTCGPNKKPNTKPQHPQKKLDGWEATRQVRKLSG